MFFPWLFSPSHSLSSACFFSLCCFPICLSQNKSILEIQRVMLQILRENQEGKQKWFSIVLSVIAPYSQAPRHAYAVCLQHSDIKAGAWVICSSLLAGTNYIMSFISWHHMLVLGVLFYILWRLTTNRLWPLHPVGIWESLGFAASGRFSCCERPLTYSFFVSFQRWHIIFYPFLNAFFLPAARLQIFWFFCLIILLYLSSNRNQ